MTDASTFNESVDAASAESGGIQHKPELRLLLDYLAPGDLCHVALNQIPTKWPARAHYHDFFEVFWLQSGRCSHWINGAIQILETGQLVFIRPSDTHRFQADMDNSSLINVTVPPTEVERLRKRYDRTDSATGFWSAQPIPQVCSLSASSLAELASLSQSLSQQVDDPLSFDAFMLYLLQATRDQVDGHDASMPRWLSEALIHAQDPAVFVLGAAGFVEVAGRGHEHVCRSTRRYLGKTPSQLMNSIRCEFAAKQLALGVEPVGHISEQCGFDNASHFFKLFKKLYGLTPSQYRKQRRQKVV